MGARVLGRKSLALTIYGTVSLSFFIWFWQQVPVKIVLQNDMMLVAVALLVYLQVQVVDWFFDMVQRQVVQISWT